MEESGMTDMQFKSHLRQLIASLQRAENAETPEKMLEIIKEMKKLYQEDLES